MNFERFLIELKRAQESGQAVVVVTVVHQQGSIPQEVGARLIVTELGYFAGTVGGGKVEKLAIEKAQEALRAGKSTSFFHDWNLQTDLGMSCGGRVSLFFEIHDPKKAWQIVIFGAGHVAQELVRVLLRLECRLSCIDSRQEWLGRLPHDSKLTTRLEASLEKAVDSLPSESFVVISTMGHSTDLPILEKILKKPAFPYLGVIGSDVKAAKLRSRLLELGLTKEKVDAFHCPMGEPIGNNTPAEIAISVVAQLLRVRGSIA